MLVELMRRMSLEEDYDLQDWLSGYWPAFFLNKPVSVLPSLRALCEDRDMDWYIRANAIEPVIKTAAEQGTSTLEQAQAWLVGIANDENEDWEFRLSACNTLLDYPSTEYRALLENMADRQSSWGKHFSRDDIQQAYSDTSKKPERFTNPWKFYEPEAIMQRQIRWREEDEKENQRILNGVADYPNHPYHPHP